MRLITKNVAFRHSSNVSVVNMLNGIYQNKLKVVCRVELKTDDTEDTVGPIPNNIREHNIRQFQPQVNTHFETC